MVSRKHFSMSQRHAKTPLGPPCIYTLIISHFNYTLQKSFKIQHDFDQLCFFYPGVVFIKLYPWKGCSFAFRLMLYLLGLFHWGVCRVSKLGAMSKRKSCKIDRIVWEIHALSCFMHSFSERMQVYPLPIRCSEILQNETCWISKFSGAILEHLFVDIASNITLCMFLPGNHNI